MPAVVSSEGANAAARRRARVGRGVGALAAVRPHARRPHHRAATVRARARVSSCAKPRAFYPNDPTPPLAVAPVSVVL